jgi:hypothetical protein
LGKNVFRGGKPFYEEKPTFFQKALRRNWIICALKTARRFLLPSDTAQSDYAQKSGGFADILCGSEGVSGTG